MILHACMYCNLYRHIIAACIILFQFQFIYSDYDMCIVRIG
jgi:hypothetical protein